MAKEIILQKGPFKRIYAINVPHMPNLMHLDTWLTIVDRSKFLYSSNMISLLKIWYFDLSQGKVRKKIINKNLKELLLEIIDEEPILIPVAGKDANFIDINIETNFDATNYLVICPGVVVGYDRNHKTQKALEEAGVKVYGFRGNQLSLGMGSARCVSMPLISEDLK